VKTRKATTYKTAKKAKVKANKPVPFDGMADLQHHEGCGCRPDTASTIEKILRDLKFVQHWCYTNEAGEGEHLAYAPAGILSKDAIGKAQVLQDYTALIQSLKAAGLPKSEENALQCLRYYGASQMQYAWFHPQLDEATKQQSTAN
jgi:hypothetical protein